MKRGKLEICCWEAEALGTGGGGGGEMESGGDDGGDGVSALDT